MTRILNFTIPAMVPLLLDGRKEQTIRGKPYWIDLYTTKKLRIGDWIQIWFNQRAKTGHKLFDAKVTNLRLIDDLSIEPPSTFLLDGFTSREEGLYWFEATYGTLEKMFLEIHFHREAPP